jgi:hypothetical protein
MHLSWLSEQASEWIVLVLFGAMMAAAEVSYRAVRRWHGDDSDAGKGHFGGVQGPLLGLLALLLAFTFGMSLQRYETRRQLVLEDANTLGSLYLRSGLLPDGPRRQFKQLLRQYVDIGADPSLATHDVTAQDLAALLPRAEAAHKQMWNLVAELSRQDPPAREAGTMLNLLTDALTIQNRRAYAFANRVPDLVIWLLLASAITATTAVGISGGLAKHRGMLARALFCILVCGAIYVVLDLDRPRRGLTQVDQGPMLRLRQVLDRDVEATS